MTLSSNNNKRPAAKATNNSDQLREAWPCLIYRLQSTRGWEVFCPSVGENGSGASSSSLKKAQPTSGKKSSQQTTMEEELTVSPRSGSIEVRKMRLRVRLFAQSQPGEGKSVNPNDNEEQNEEDENNSDFVGADGWNNNALVVRRKDSLLVTTRRGMGALMFRFKSVQHCIEFCDRLVFLNQEYFMPSSSSTANGNHSASIINHQNESSMSGMDQRELYVDEMRSKKRRKADTISDQHQIWNSGSRFRGATSTGAQNDDWARSGEEEYRDASAMQYRRKDELLSYIVKLSRDEDFCGFVDEISRGLEAAGDNAGIYRSLKL